jgi:ribosomal protein S18 acetylase RimI-like enzyme
MAPEPACQEVHHGSLEYQQALSLREAVLRQPLGLAWQPDELAAEATSRHLACFDGEKLAGTLVLVPVDARTVRMRQVAIAPKCQRQGFGAALVRFAEDAARRAGFDTVTAHAREVAVPFYQRLGYAVEGESFTEVGIPHFRISKRLGTR